MAELLDKREQRAVLVMGRAKIAQAEMRLGLQALLHQLDALARQQPVLMVVEDVHWIDPSSRELLDLIIERAANLPVLLILTFRPEFQAPWNGLPQVTALIL